MVEELEIPSGVMYHHLMDKTHNVNPETIEGKDEAELIRYHNEVLHGGAKTNHTKAWGRH